MKFARYFAVMLGILASALMVFSIGLCLVSLNARVTMPQAPEGATACSDALREAVNAGDYEAMSQVLFGQPDLGVHGKPENLKTLLVWDAFLGSLSLEYKGACYATDSGVARDAVVRGLNLSAMTGALDRQAHALLTARVEEAETMAELYDETNNFREDLVEEVLQEALIRCLSEDVSRGEQEITVKLICRDGQWWAVPDSALLDMLSGGL